jgi:hypothetical protein
MAQRTVLVVAAGVFTLPSNLAARWTSNTAASKMAAALRIEGYEHRGSGKIGRTNGVGVRG